MKFKKTTSLLLAVLIAISALPLGGVILPDLGFKVSAATVTDSGTCGADGDNVTWTLDSDGTLTISGEGEMENYNYRDSTPWENLKVTDIVIENGVTSIGDYTFRGCSSLTSVTISDSVTSIGWHAFSGCTGLTSITIPDGVTSIGNYTFYECSSLTSITIPDSVTEIGNSAFSGCSSLASVTIPDGVTSIDSYTFYECSGLTSITIPDSVTEIGNSAFYGCSSLASVTIPDSVIEISETAFEDVANVKYTGSVTGSPWGARTVNGYVEDGLVYKNADRTELTACPTLRTGDVIIPDGVISIGDSAFYGCSNLTSIMIPDGVTIIGDHAFRGCCSLTSITIPDGVTSIGIYAFNFVANVEYSGSADGSPWGARTINGYVEAGCVYKNSDKTNLTACPSSKSGEVIIPDSVTVIGSYAFYNCTGLTNITIPDSVTGIGNSAFSGCSSLTSITIPDGVTRIEIFAFEDCSSLTSVTIPDSVTSIGICAFFGCSSLTSITIPDGVTSIGEWAFYDCSSLADIYFNNPNCEICDDEWTIDDNAVIHGYVGSTAQEYAEKYGRTFVPIDHQHEYTVETTKADCTHNGAKTFTCTGCGNSYTETIPAKGHTWDAGKVTKPAAVGVKGVKTFTCTVCKTTRTEDIPALTPTEPKAVEVKATEKAKTLSSGFVGATHSVKISELLASSNASYVVDKDGKKLTDTSKPLATGMKLVLESNGKKVEKVISVLGDIDGNGEMAVADARLALRAAVGLDELKGAYLDAAKVGGNEKVEVSDARLILRAAVQLETGKDWLGKVK